MKSKKGYLRSKLNDYFACLKLDENKFAQLMNKDLKAWQEIRDKKKEELTNNFDVLKAQLDREQTQIDQITQRAKIIEAKKTLKEPTLFRLPDVYGNIPDDQIDFQWPKKEDLMDMEDGIGVKLQSIAIQYLNNNRQFPIQSIQVILSNGESSPWF